MSLPIPYDSGLEIEERDETLIIVLVHAKCPQLNCGGEMIGTGYGMTTNETHWVNRCNACGTERWLRHNYPTLKHKKVK